MITHSLSRKHTHIRTTSTSIARSRRITFSLAESLTCPTFVRRGETSDDSRDRTFSAAVGIIRFVATVTNADGDDEDQHDNDVDADDKGSYGDEDEDDGDGYTTHALPPRTDDSIHLRYHSIFDATPSHAKRSGNTASIAELLSPGSLKHASSAGANSLNRPLDFAKAASREPPLGSLASSAARSS